MGSLHRKCPYSLKYTREGRRTPASRHSQSGSLSALELLCPINVCRVCDTQGTLSGCVRVGGEKV